MKGHEPDLTFIDTLTFFVFSSAVLCCNNLHIKMQDFVTILKHLKCYIFYKTLIFYV